MRVDRPGGAQDFHRCVSTRATGLGAYIAKATQVGDFHRILAGVTIMALYIVTLNRLFWRRLDHLAEHRYS